MAKRYVLYMADSALSAEDLRLFAEVMKGRVPGAKVIGVRGNPKAVIVKTNNEQAPLLRESTLKLGGKGAQLKTVLTSGAIGNLKRRANEVAANGQVS